MPEAQEPVEDRAPQRRELEVRHPLQEAAPSLGEGDADGDAARLRRRRAPDRRRQDRREGHHPVCVAGGAYAAPLRELIVRDDVATRMVGRYELLREIGRGGMAVVHLARQVELDRFVAIKELGSFHASDPTIARRFLRESRLAGSLTHTNIVTVLDYFEHDGTPYIAMAYIAPGSTPPHVGHRTLA